MATLAVSTKEQASTAGGVVGGLVFVLGGAAIQLAILGALYRMSLRETPAPGLYYLRLSRDEGRLFVLWLALGALVEMDCVAFRPDDAPALGDML